MVTLSYKRSQPSNILYLFVLVHCKFMDLDSVSDHEHIEKKNMASHPVILTEQAWSTVHTCMYMY